MKEFNRKYEDYIQAFRKHTFNELNLTNNEKNDTTNSDEDFNSFIESSDILLKVNKELQEIFFREIRNNKLDYEYIFTTLLDNAIATEDWERFLLIKDLYNWTVVKKSINDSICNAINTILSMNLLVTDYGVKGRVEWCKGTFLNYLIEMLDIKTKSESLQKTLERITVELNKNNIENIHVINCARNILGS